jgi:hypothetical protein
MNAAPPSRTPPHRHPKCLCHSSEARGARALLLDPLVISITAFVLLLWLLFFGGYVFLDDIEGWRAIKAAVLNPLIGPLNAIHLLTLLNAGWLLLFAVRALRGWATKRRPRWQTIIVSAVGILLSVQLQWMTFSLAHAMEQFDNDEIPSDAVMIEQFREHHEHLERLVRRLQSNEGGRFPIPQKHWTFELRPGQRLQPTLFLIQSKEDTALFRSPIAPRAWLAYDQGQRVHFATKTRGIAPRFLIKGYYYGRPPEPRLESLDELREGKPGFAAYRHIEGSWYLFVIRTPVVL